MNSLKVSLMGSSHEFFEDLHGSLISWWEELEEHEQKDYLSCLDNMGEGDLIYLAHHPLVFQDREDDGTHILSFKSH